MQAGMFTHGMEQFDNGQICTLASHTHTHTHTHTPPIPNNDVTKRQLILQPLGDCTGKCT